MFYFSTFRCREFFLSVLRLRLPVSARLGNEGVSLNYHACVLCAESGKAGEVLKLAAVFPTADNEF